MKKSENKNENKAPEIINAKIDPNENANINKINAVSSSSVQNKNPNFNNSNTATVNANKPINYWDEENSRKLASSILTG